MIEKNRGYLTALQTRVRELKGQGTSADEAARIVSAEFRAAYPDWTNPARVTDAATSAYAEQR